MKRLLDQLDSLQTRQIQANLLFKPLFYRLQNEHECKAFSTLLSTPGLIVADTIADQLKELVKYKNPEIRFSTNDLESGTKEILDGRTLAEFGVWVYYPWANRVVHCLDEEDFINIRTSRNQYKITRGERDLLAQKKIGVIGLSVGQSVSVTVAMERLCGELRLADFDTLELNNLNRIRTGVHNLGLPKVYSVAREIAEIDPFLKVTCFTQGLIEENMDAFFTDGGKLDLLIEESDGFDIKILSRYKARELKVPVLMEASDGCVVDVERFDLEPERSILHGIIDHLDIATLKSLKTSEEKIPYMLDVLGLETSSLRIKASMVEMNQSINTWPQLASAVAMGGGVTADVARRLLLNQYTESGRYRVDLEEIIGNKKEKKAPVPEPLFAGWNAATMTEACKKYKGGSTSAADAPTLEKLVEAAGAAPSFANRQPWKWASYESRLFLFFNPLRQHSLIDVAGTGAGSSLGAAIENMALKAEACGLEATIELLPVETEKNLIAAISFKKKATGAEEGLSAFIGQRHTNRRPGSGKAIEPEALQEMSLLAEHAQGMALSFITEAEKINMLATAAGVAERMCLLHPELHREYFSDLRIAGDKPVVEGVDLKTLQLPVLAETAYKVVSDARVADLLYRWEKGIAFEKVTSALVNSSSALGLITAPAGDYRHIVNAGRLVQKTWLTATKNNLGFQPICLPLYLLRQFDNKDKDRIFPPNIISGLEYIKKQFLQVFPGMASRENVFLFRLSDAGTPTTRSLRKPLNEVYFKL
jgi:tRNA A37 threonylcarbamoyladenosine dehydratase